MLDFSLAKQREQQKKEEGMEEEQEEEKDAIEEQQYQVHGQPDESSSLESCDFIVQNFY